MKEGIWVIVMIVVGSFIGCELSRFIEGTPNGLVTLQPVIQECGEK